jgi:CPA2 family monovalent cation:H+ antiporter-2
MVVAAARDLAPGLPIIARAATEEGVKRLSDLGAQNVIHPEMEGGLEIVRHTLMQLGFPLREVYEYADAVRHDHYDLQVNSNEEHRLLHDLLDALDGIEVTWLRLPDGSPMAGRTLSEANLRARTGASVIAVRRGRQLIPNPKSVTVFEAGDRIGVIGDREQIEAAEKMLSRPPFRQAQLE